MSLSVSAPSGQHIPAFITGSPSNNFHVEYKPVEAGMRNTSSYCNLTKFQISDFFPHTYLVSI